MLTIIIPHYSLIKEIILTFIQNHRKTLFFNFPQILFHKPPLLPPSFLLFTSAPHPPFSNPQLDSLPSADKIIYGR